MIDNICTFLKIGILRDCHYKMSENKIQNLSSSILYNLNNVAEYPSLRYFWTVKPDALLHINKEKLLEWSKIL